MLLAGLLGGISVGCLVWFVMKLSMDQRDLAHHLSFPYGLPIQSKSANDAKISTEELTQNKSARDLFQAGIQKRSEQKLFLKLIKGSFYLVLLFPLGYFAMTAILGIPFHANLLGLMLLIGIGIHVVARWSVAFRKTQRRQAMLRTLPDFFDLLIVCLDAGLNFTAALPRVIQEYDARNPLAKEFTLLHNEYLNGLPFAKACERMAKRCALPQLSVIMNALVQSQQMGTSLGQALRIQAMELRDEYRQRVREKAYKIPVKLVFPICLLLVGAVMPICGGPVASRMLHAFGSLGGDEEKPERVFYEKKTMGESTRAMESRTI